MIDLAPEQLAIVLRLLAVHVPECEVRAFGSRVSWTAKAHSDLDLALVGPVKIATSRLSRLREAFEESNLSIRVDLLDWHAVSESFRNVIAKQYEIIQQAAKVSVRRAQWTATTLGAEVDLLTGFPFKSERYTDAADGIRLVRGDNIVQGVMRWDGVKKWPAMESAQYGMFQLREGDVVLAMDRPWIEAGLKYAAISKYDLPCLLVQRTTRLRGGPKLDNGFLRYLIGSQEFTQHIHAITTGTAVPHVSGGQIKEFAFSLPPLAEQKAIAAVLGALDDKIELNRRMNATLEGMARALFQSWFIDFDPVRAKLDGHKLLALDPATNALFPASFDETKLGYIPHGWTAGNFGEIISAERKRIGVSDAVVLSAVASSQLVRSDEHFNKQVYSKSISNYLKVRHWNFAYNPSRINIGSIGMLKENIVGAVSPVYEVFNPKTAYHWFVERALAQLDTKGWIQTLCSGSVRQSLKLRDLESIPLVIPPLPIVQAFNKAWEPWYQLIQASERESHTLVALRDTLLPKLLSGEVSVIN